MIPIRDTLASRNYPIVNVALIGINIGVYLLQLAQGPGLTRFIYYYGLVPARYTVAEFAAYFSLEQQLFALVSFMFLHGSFWHLLANLWTLYIFGDNVEDRLGSLRYLVFYLMCGIASGFAHLLFNLTSNVPTIGASGAIAGVMGAYFVLYPKARILTLIPIIIIPYFIEIPAWFFMGLWLLIQFMNVAGASAASSGIAWWAHIGGFVAGMLFLKFFRTIPETGLSRPMRQVTHKHTTPHLQVIQATGYYNDPNLYGSLTISPREAQNGVRKLVNIPWGFHKRLIRITVPPGLPPGGVLRLKGLGKTIAGAGPGDLLLKVIVQTPEDSPEHPQRYPGDNE